MKKLVIFSAIIATFLFGCKSQQKATTYTYDDVYSTRSDHSKITSKPKIQDEDLTGSHPITSPDSSTVLTPSSATSNEDYSNNSYSTRIKRFNGKNSGLNYNNDYYTRSSDSTSSSSGGSSPDVNFYFGNSWGSSFWGPSYSFGLGYGWGDCGFCYPYSWYSPYSWCYPYYGYPYSYWYWDYPYSGYGYHYWDWGWNNGNNRGSYYGQRRTLSTPDGGRNSRTTTTGATLGSSQVKNTRTIEPGVINRSKDQTRSVRTDVNRVPPDKQHYRYTRSGIQQNTRFIKNTQDNKIRSERNYVQRQEPAPKYTRPGNQQQANRSESQIYSSPAYRQPKSSQEYINPRSNRVVLPV